MTRIQLSENLFLDEYIPKDTYMAFQTKGSKFYGMPYMTYMGILKRKINPNLIKSDQMLRDKFGPVTLNDWWDGGRFQFRGWRPTWYKEGGELSDHREGNASDKVFKNFDAKVIRDYIKENYVSLGITIIEDNVSWLHSAVSFTDNKSLVIVNP